jgi:hypothetical protein
MYFTHMPSDPVLYVDPWQSRTISIVENCPGQNSGAQRLGARKSTLQKQLRNDVAPRAAQAKSAGKSSLAADGEKWNIRRAVPSSTAEVQLGRSASQATPQRVNCLRRLRRT